METGYEKIVIRCIKDYKKIKSRIAVAVETFRNAFFANFVRDVRSRSGKDKINSFFTSLSVI
jgi:hypothetical protein